jgi:hypothetical protein
MSSERCRHFNPHGQNICPHPAWSGSEKRLCLFHDPSPERPEGEFQALLKEKLSEKDFNFEGYVFPVSVLFRDFVFSEFANFENCLFLGKETSFYKAVFQKGVLFNQATFRGNRVNFSRAQFLGDFNLFNGSAFEAWETVFQETHFSGKHIGFASARFSGQRLIFQDARFQGSVFFTQCQFASALSSFEKVRSNGEFFSFAESQFEGKELRFNGAEFSGEKVDFSQIQFKADQILYSNALMKAKSVLFINSTFQTRKVSFQNARFDTDNLSFVHAYFNAHEIDFSEVTLQGNLTDFTGSYFQAKSLKFYPITLNNQTTNFSRTEFSGDEKTLFILNPQKNDLSFQGVFFHGGRTKLKGDLHAASFIDTSLDNVDLNEASWEIAGGRLTCRDEIDANRVNTVAHFRKAIDVCRSIKQCYENFGSYETAGNFYYGEMECKRKVSSRKNWGGLQFMRFTSGYGESPVRVIFTSLFVMFGCAFFYLLGGVETPNGIIKLQSFSEISQFSTVIHNFLNCIYFSVVSFTTLGYGDYHPVGWSRVVGASEGFIGAFFMAMFVLTVGRKMNR